MRSYFKAFKYYATSEGRTSRRDFLMFFLFDLLFFVLFSFVDALIDSFLGGTTFYSLAGYGIISILYLLVTFCPSVCIQVRRLHDVGKNGHWIIASCVPILNWYLIYLLLKKSSPDANEYGRSAQPTKKKCKPGEPRCPICGNPLSEDALMCSFCGYMRSHTTKSLSSIDMNTIESNDMIDQVEHIRCIPHPEEVPQTTEDEMSWTCPNCRNSLPQDSVFCPFCGTKIDCAVSNVSIKSDNAKPNQIAATTEIEKRCTSENIPYTSTGKSIVVSSPLHETQPKTDFPNSGFMGTIDERYRAQITDSQHYFDADYGYSAENPMVVSSVKMEGCYLYAFRALDGRSFEWERLPKAVGSMIDGYNLYLDGQLFKQIFFNPYGNDSAFLPKGIKVNQDPFEAAKQGISLEQYQYNRMEEINIQEQIYQKRVRKKKIAKRIILVLLCMILLVGILFAAYKYAHPYVRYCIANRNFMAGNYENAIAVYSEMGNYRESKAMLTEARYALAQTLYSEGRFEEASALFQDVKLHKDSADMINRCTLGMARQYMDQGDFDSALNCLEELATGQEVNELTSECYYQLIKQDINEGNWANAYNYYKSLTAKKHLSADKVKDYKYKIYIEYAKAQLAQGTEISVARASTLVKELSGEYDTEELSALCVKISEMKTQLTYEYGLDLLETGNYEMAVKKFESVLDYKDSKTQRLEAMYQFVCNGIKFYQGDSDSATNRLGKIIYDSETMNKYAKTLADNNYKDGKSLYKELTT